MKQNSKRARVTPRVGTEYQAIIPEFNDCKIPSSTDISETSIGRSVWAPLVSTEVVDKYLDFARGLFRDRTELCEERALYLLKRCQYNLKTACNLLTPCEPEEEPQAEIGGDPLYEGDDFCMVCGDGGTLIVCDFESCKKGKFHPALGSVRATPAASLHALYEFAEKNTFKELTYFHHQATPSPDYRCIQCPTSYCTQHLPTNLKRLLDKCH
eukprot:1333461-Amorphochlora_amoeboformis.AAC.1